MNPFIPTIKWFYLTFSQTSNRASGFGKTESCDQVANNLKNDLTEVIVVLPAGPNGIPGIPGSRDFELIKIPGFLIIKSRDFSGSACRV